MIITFAGHSDISQDEKLIEIVKEQIKSNITVGEPVFCYLGGYGEFDKISACACRELKKEINGIELVYVTPYMSLSEQIKIKEMQERGFYDSSIYPSLEKIPPRFAISKRNEWMIDKADIIIAYVNRSFGGAYKSLQKAKKKNKKIINICEIIGK